METQRSLTIQIYNIIRPVTEHAGTVRMEFSTRVIRSLLGGGEDIDEDTIGILIETNGDAKSAPPGNIPTSHKCTVSDRKIIDGIRVTQGDTVIYADSGQYMCVDIRGDAHCHYPRRRIHLRPIE